MTIRLKNMNLRELRNMDTHESRTELITALDKLKWIFVYKAREMCNKDKKALGALRVEIDVLPDRASPRGEVWFNYLNGLGIESKYGPMPYEDGPDFINISINVFKIKWPNQWHIKVPVEMAERILVLGLP